MTMPNTMPDNKSPDLPSTASDVLRHTAAPRPSLAARVTARLRAHRLDRQPAVGGPGPAGRALAVHQARVTSVAERQAIARALRLAERDARAGGNPRSSRISVHPNNNAVGQGPVGTLPHGAA